MTALVEMVSYQFLQAKSMQAKVPGVMNLSVNLCCSDGVDFSHLQSMHTLCIIHWDFSFVLKWSTSASRTNSNTACSSKNQLEFDSIMLLRNYEGR